MSPKIKGKGLLNEEFQRLQMLVEDGRKFFDFEGERKEPPAGGGDGKQEEELKVETTAFKPEPSKAPEKDDKPIRMLNRGWNL